MFVLFLLLMTAPGQFEVKPLEFFHGPQAQVECVKMETQLQKEFERVYNSVIERDTFGFKCLKQKEKEA